MNLNSPGTAFWKKLGNQKMAKILVTGASGLVGSRFVELHPNPTELLIPGHQELDMTNRQSVTEYFAKNQPNVIVNFAAYTNVGEGEKQRGDKTGDCWKLNVEGVQNLLDCMTPSTFFVQISTDMVFPGSVDNPGPYGEDDRAETDSNKLTWYGFCKAEAERIATGHTILRLIYPVRAKFDKKLDYLRKPLQSFDQRKLWPLFTDQQVSFCFIDETCAVLEKIIDGKVKGIYHASSSDTTNPYELISYLLDKARGFKGELKTQSLDEFLKNPANSPVRYPKFGGLKVAETEKKLGIKFSTWKEIIDKLVAQGIAV